MPGFDRTGPWGEGPMSGWRYGYCGEGSEYVPRGYRNFGFGSGRGRGGGRRNRFWAYAGPVRPLRRRFDWYETPYSEENELEMLQDEAKYLEKELSSINKEIERIKKTTAENK